MIFLELFLGFLAVGLFSFGGAYVAIPLIRDVVLSYGWIDEEMLANMIAVSESTPGPIMVNLATYIGSSKAGIAGAALATATVILPAFLIILLVVLLSGNLMNNKYIRAVMGGLKPCVAGIILATGAFMILGNCFLNTGNGADITAIAITAVLGLIYFGSRRIVKKGISPICLICISAITGIIVYGM